MKNNFFKNTAIILAVMVSSVANAALTFPVDYSSFFATAAVNSGGTTLETGNTAAVGTWAVGNAGVNAANPTISTNNLSYSNYIDNNKGKKISLASLIAGSTARTSVYYLTSSTSELTSGPYYLSFMLNVSAVSGSALNIISFGNASAGGSLRGRLYIKSVTGGFQLGATIDGSPLNYYSTTTLTTGTTYLVVLKQKIDLASATAGSGTTSIFINPVIGDPEPATPNATATETAAVTGLDCIKSIAVSQNIGVAAEIAGLRLSTSWADVCKPMAAPKLTTPTASAASSATTSGFTANWTAVSNAQGYDVKVYQNASLIKTVNAAGQSASSVAVSGLTSSLPCSFTVTAVGDGISFSNSDPSTGQTVILPIDYSNFFSTSAVNASATTLETGNSAALGTWALAGTANGSNPVINANDLSYSTYIDNSAAQKISLLSDVTATRNSLFYITSSVTDMTSGPYYLSFLLKVNAAPSSTATFITFANTNAGGQRGRVNMMSIGAGFQLGASLTGSTVYYPTTLAFATTYLVVLKQQITVNSTGTAGVNTDGSATTSIFVNPVLGAAEPAPNATKSESAVNSLDCIKSIIISQQPGLGAELSGLRFSTNWSDVVAASPATGIRNIGSEQLIFANKTLVAPEAGNFELYTLQGMRILSIQNKKQVGLTFAKGIYLVKFNSQSGTSITQKIVLE